MKKEALIELMVFVDDSNLDASTVMICSLAIEKKTFDSLVKKIRKKHGILSKLPEIHYKEFDRADNKKRNLANSYIDYIADKSYEKKIFLNIVIADKSKLKTGEKRGAKRDTHIETIFTRLSITYSINRFSYKYRKIVVKKITIDKGGKTDNSFFQQYALSKILTRSKAKLPKNIDYIDSDPRKEEKKNAKYAVFVDIIDLILGSCKNCCSKKRSENKYKRNISEKIFNDLLIRVSAKRSKIGKINTYPRIRKTQKHTDKLLSGGLHQKKRYIYSENPILRKKFAPKPYVQITKWDR